jgi:hypothetical protein
MEYDVATRTQTWVEAWQTFIEQMLPSLSATAGFVITLPEADE